MTGARSAISSSSSITSRGLIVRASRFPQRGSTFASRIRCTYSGPPALALDVTRHELRARCSTECPGGPSGAGSSGFTRDATGESGASRIDAAAEEAARCLGLLVRVGESGLRPSAEHQACPLPVPVEAPVPGLDSRVGHPELQSGARWIIDLVPVVPWFQRFHATTCQPCNVFEWSHSGPFLPRRPA